MSNENEPDPRHILPSSTLKWKDGCIFSDLEPMEIAKLDLGPDDVLVLRTSRSISCDRQVQFKELIEQIMPGRKVMILDGGIEISVLHEDKAAK